MGDTLAILLLRRLSPLPEGYETDGPSLDELRPRYSKWHLSNIALMFAGIAWASVTWWYLFSQIAAWNDARYEPAVFHLHDTGLMLAAPAFLLGIVTAGLLLAFVYRGLLGEHYPDYVRFENLLYGFDGKRIRRPMLVGTFGLSVLLFAAALSWHVAFQNDRVNFHSWCGMGDASKLYSQIKEIRSAPQLKAPSGRLVDRREYIVEFDDGSTWSTNFEPARLDPQTKQQLVTFVAGRAKKRVRELQVLE